MFNASLLVILRPKAEESLANVSLSVILRPKAEESLANARNEKRFLEQVSSLAITGLVAKLIKIKYTL
jgi:hypothetical protein